MLDSLSYPRSVAVVGARRTPAKAVISVHDDTFTTVEKIEHVLGKIRIREQKKVLKTREITGKEFDFRRFLKELKIK